MTKQLLEVNNLRISFHTYAGEVQAVRGVSFKVSEGECMAIVGESGSGKTVTSKAVLGLIEPPSGEVKATSSITFAGQEILNFSDRQWRNYRGKDAAMIFQDPMTSLNPTMKIGRQIMENILLHNKISRQEARQRTVELLQMVNIPNPEERLTQYPYEFSGGMRQRVVIAIALACKPRLMIADEPTTALDVTIQAQILQLLRNIQQQEHTAVIMITHDLGVVAGMADFISVMYAGRIVEQGSVIEIFNHPQHPYTSALLKAVPSLSQPNKAPLQIIPGTPPDMIAPPQGCGFASRCQYCMKICQQRDPAYTRLSDTHQAACWLHEAQARTAFGYQDVSEVFNHA
ncbi:MAG: ABC transporter ATP-binding protein [Oscillospiraceae bacterium]|nr:ABC transporter ATP-binding protein [Oscillospiraceae bacterium]